MRRVDTVILKLTTVDSLYANFQGEADRGSLDYSSFKLQMPRSKNGEYDQRVTWDSLHNPTEIEIEVNLVTAPLR